MSPRTDALVLLLDLLLRVLLYAVSDQPGFGQEQVIASERNAYSRHAARISILVAILGRRVSRLRGTE